MGRRDAFEARTPLTQGGPAYYRLEALEKHGFEIRRLPYSIRVLLESCLRNVDDFVYTEDHVRALAGYDATKPSETEIPFMPGRVVLQDFTGVPAIVDFAALRSAMQRLQGDVKKVNPLIRADLVIDHSIQVDEFRSPDAMDANTKREFERNLERYQFLKWGQLALSNFSVVPPETGIVHQVNLEYLASGVLTESDASGNVAFPDSLVGTDSHTTMINGLGVLGWGVGGIEAEACMLGQPIYMLIPEVVGVRLSGRLREGSTATDVVLTVTQMLRKHGVVSKFVEFYGPGVGELALADRATIANMAPEYGATVGFFPIDQGTLDYMRLSGRPESTIQLVEAYAKANLLWRDDSDPIVYGSTLALDLSMVEPSLAGPKRPQDRVPLSQMKDAWHKALPELLGSASSFGKVKTSYRGEEFELTHGDVAIAAITSCTNTSNPSVMIGAGLLAKKAAERGLVAKPWVKTSLAPGSRVVTDYLEKAGLMKALETVGFYTVGYGCTTCIGNSGPLPDPIRESVEKGGLVVNAVLSGNRNFEGRVSPHTRGNYLMSPMLVVAYALAGTVDLDLATEPLAVDRDGKPVFLGDVWPTSQEIADTVAKAVSKDQFQSRYANVFQGPTAWRALSVPTGQVYAWNSASTYIQEPPFFQDMAKAVGTIQPIRGARCLLKLGHSVTTDHISPAGDIAATSPAGRYLQSLGVPVSEFNSYGSRRGNDRVMTRGTFANIRIKNQLAPGTEGGVTKYLGPPQRGPKPPLVYTSEIDPKPGEVCSVYDASVKYQSHGIPLVVLTGKDYGMGSSRDWAAKGTFLLGVRAVIAESYERIHRSNLIGMGVLPLQYKDGETAESLGLTGTETFSFEIGDGLQPLQDVKVTAVRENGTKSFVARCRIDTPVEVVYYRNGGILHTVLRRLAA